VVITPRPFFDVSIDIATITMKKEQRTYLSPFPFTANQHQSSNPHASPHLKHPKPQTIRMNPNQTKNQ
jgi:hypothetical protein